MYHSSHVFIIRSMWFKDEKHVNVSVTQQLCMTLTFKHIHTHKNIYQINGSPIGTNECQLSPGSFYFYLCCCTSWKPDSRDTDVIPFLLFPIAATPHCKEKKSVRSPIPTWISIRILADVYFPWCEVMRHWLWNKASNYIDKFTSTWLQLFQIARWQAIIQFSKNLRGSIKFLNVWLMGFVVLFVIYRLYEIICL